MDLKKFEFKNYGFLTIYQALKSIPEIVDVVQPQRGPAVASLSKSALDRLNDDEDTILIPAAETNFPDLSKLKIEPSGTSMPPPLSPAKSPRKSIAGIGRGMRMRTDDDIPLGYEAGNNITPPPLRRLGTPLAKPATVSSPIPVFETEEELYAYLKKKTGIDDMEILEAMMTPEKVEFMKRQQQKKKEAQKLLEETGSVKLPKETQDVFKKILASDNELRGIPITSFIAEYKKMAGHEIDPVSLGFNSVMEILRSSPTLLYVSHLISMLFKLIIFL